MGAKLETCVSASDPKGVAFGIGLSNMHFETRCSLIDTARDIEGTCKLYSYSELSHPVARPA